MTLIDPDVRRLRDVALSDKYDLEDGTIFCSGIQAIARLPFDQRRADARAGLQTGGFVSGYQGSPLGGIDKELLRLADLMERWNVHFQPGLNEELAATSVVGTQLVGGRESATVDGVTGWWYGKNPGLDRAADAIRHGTFQGASRHGGMVLWVGDDPGCKSSTLPSAAEATLAALHVPVLYPSSVQEVLDLGRHAVEMSRVSGLWSALKIVTSVADSAGTADVGSDRIVPVVPEVEWMGRPFVHQPNAMLLAPDSMALERSLLHVRLDAARAYARANRLDEIAGARGDAWLGIMASGRTYRELRSALALLGLDDAALERRGIRLLHVRMPWPLDAETIRQFADGLEEIVVVEEKLPFMEEQIKHLLYRTPGAPEIVGKLDETGRALLHPEGELLSDEIALAVAARARRRVHDQDFEARVSEIETVSRYMARPMPMARTPFFCSGCPHNTSTAAPEGALVGGGIGCHTMIVLNREGKGDIAGITQMGGEGAQWIGMAPFVEDRHLTQNLGDGTFHHSGSLAVRASVAAGTNITYKLLYNGFVSMTGGQEIEGQLSVPALTNWLALEGVRRIIITTEDPGRYRGVSLNPIAEVRDRGEIDAAQRELAAVPGTTVLIHDQVCAAEKRRLTKRGKIAPPAFRVAINERVCEGCGDCGRKSSCLSVIPTDTEFGRKTQIHQASCNTDYSCLQGDCPSFLTVIPAKQGAGAPRREAPAPPRDLPAPDPARSTAMIRMIGIGGTGVVTVSQILGMAAHLDGLHVSSLDQTGLAQKGGPVVSDILISDRAIDGSNRAAPASVDTYLAFDALGGADAKNLRTASPERTTAVVSTSVTATGAVVSDPSREMPGVDLTLERIDRHTHRERNVYLDAQALSQALFADHMPANAIVLGAAFQRGLLPVSEAALERAFTLNGAAVEKNLAAFAWGRAVVAAPDAIAAVTPAPAIARTLEEIVDLRIAELTDYQDAAYAERYRALVEEARAAERAAGVEGTRYTEAVAKGLFKLMAYKDEYEVARLHLDPAERARVEREFGPGARVQVNLHPPLMRAMGLDHKLKFGPWFDPGLKALYRMRRLRGTRLDPFGRAEVRRVERALIEEYVALLRLAGSRLDASNHGTCVELAALPDVVRGYEDIKLANVARFREQAAALRAQLGS